MSTGGGREGVLLENLETFVGPRMPEGFFDSGQFRVTASRHATPLDSPCANSTPRTLVPR